VAAFAALHMSLPGTKRTCRNIALMSVVGGQADIRNRRRHVY
jgi:hypothetical protein